jgi:hypothetical protein
MTGEGAMGVSLSREASYFWYDKSGGSDTPLNLPPVWQPVLLRRKRCCSTQKPAMRIVVKSWKGEIDGYLN